MPKPIILADDFEPEAKPEGIPRELFIVAMCEAGDDQPIRDDSSGRFFVVCTNSPYATSEWDGGTPPLVFASLLGAKAMARKAEAMFSSRSYKVIPYEEWPKVFFEWYWENTHNYTNGYNHE